MQEKEILPVFRASKRRKFVRENRPEEDGYKVSHQSSADPLIVAGDADAQDSATLGVVYKPLTSNRLRKHGMTFTHQSALDRNREHDEADLAITTMMKSPANTGGMLDRFVRSGGSQVATSSFDNNLFVIPPRTASGIIFVVETNT